MNVITFEYCGKIYGKRRFKHGQDCAQNKCAFLEVNCFELMERGHIPHCNDKDDECGWCYDEITTAPAQPVSGDVTTAMRKG